MLAVWDTNGQPTQHTMRNGGSRIRNTRYALRVLTPTEREAFLRRVDRLVWTIARRHHPMQPLDSDDLYQEGILAVWKLVSHWEGSDDDHLLNAACQRANGQMIDAIRAARWARRSGGQDSNHEPPISIETPVAGAAGERLHISDTITEPARPLDDMLAVDEWTRLRDRRRAAMLLMAAVGYSQPEIARRFGVTDSRVSQILSRGDTVFTRGGGRRVAA